MDQLEPLLPLSSHSPTPTSHSSVDPIKPPPPISPNPKKGATVCVNSPHSFPPLLLRLTTILALLLLSLWANYEASKGFDLTILKATTHTLTGRRFNLLFVSNGRAAEMALESSRFIEHILYPDEAFPRKPVCHVTIRLADHNITSGVLVSSFDNRVPAWNGKYLIEISASVMAQKDAMTKAVASALHRGMAYVWLWDGHGTVPQPIIDAMVEYLLVQSNLPLKDYGSTQLTSTVAHLIQLCEDRSKGFMAHLNSAMKEKWDELAVTNAFSSPSEMMCLSRIISASKGGLLADNAELDLELNQAM